MIRLGGVVPLLVKLGAAKPCTLEVFQVPSALWVKIPKETALDINGVLCQGGVASRCACRWQICETKQGFMGSRSIQSCWKRERRCRHEWKTHRIPSSVTGCT